MTLLLTDSCTDAELASLEHRAAHDDSALHQLIELWLPLFYRTASIPDRYSEKDDRVHDAIVAIIKYIHKFDPNKAKFSTWANTIVKRSAWKQESPSLSCALCVTAEALPFHLHGPDEKESLTLFEREDFEKEVHESLELAIDAISHQKRPLGERTALIVRLHLEGLSFTKIGKQLGISGARANDLHITSRGFIKEHMKGTLNARTYDYLCKSGFDQFLTAS